MILHLSTIVLSVLTMRATAQVVFGDRPAGPRVNNQQKDEEEPRIGLVANLFQQNPVTDFDSHMSETIVYGLSHVLGNSHHSPQAGPPGVQQRHPSSSGLTEYDIGPGRNDGCYCARDCYDISDLIDIRIVNRPGDQLVCPQGTQRCCGDNGDINGGSRICYLNAPYRRSCGRSLVEQYGTRSAQADFGEYPWMGLILDKGNRYIGGAVLINDRQVLTATHKVYQKQPYDLKVRLGEWDASGTRECKPHVERNVRRIENHYDFDSRTLAYDMSIITLEQSVPLDQYPHINAACVPGYNYRPSPSAKCWVTGYGKDSFGSQGQYQAIMKQVDVPIVDSRTCSRQLSEALTDKNRQKGRGPVSYRVHPSFICAGGVQGKDACEGDGGSPMVCQERGGPFYVVGLVAWGVGCAYRDVPGVYVNVPYVLNNWCRRGSGSCQRPRPFDGRDNS